MFILTYMSSIHNMQYIYTYTKHTQNYMYIHNQKNLLYMSVLSSCKYKNSCYYLGALP